MNDNSPIRVAVVMGKYVTGGIKSVILNYYSAIDKKKVQFDLIVDKNSSDGDYYEFTSQGAKIYEVTSIQKNPLKNIIETKKILKVNNYKIVHGYLNTLNIFPMIAGFLAGTKIRIAENLSTSHAKEPKTVFKNLLKPFGKFFATNLAANSKYAAEWLFGKEKLNEVAIFRNGLDLEKFHYDSDIRKKRRNELDIANGEFVIGHIGRYQFQKNHSFLIDIFEEVHKRDSDSLLLLIGYGELKDEIWRKIKEKNLEPYIIDGGANTENVPNYNAMDCFVMPSYYEGLPVVGIEAQATGLPCVFSTEITIETAITIPITFLTLSDDLSTWADRILSYKENPRNSSKNEITDHGYNIKIESDELCLYYEKLLR